jgi:ketosteroid isomerase-like protein
VGPVDIFRFCRQTLGKSASGRVISYRIDHFMRVRDGKVAEFRSIIDMPDAAEQVLARSLTDSAA